MVRYIGQSMCLDLTTDNLHAEISNALTVLMRYVLRWLDDHPEAASGQVVLYPDVQLFDVSIRAALAPFGVLDTSEGTAQ